MTLEVSLSIFANYPAGEVLALAQAAERMGFMTAWIADEGEHTADPWVLAGALAVATERMHIGPGITNPYSRHPQITANALASLLDLSRGRAFIGLGAGGALALPVQDEPLLKPLAAVRSAMKVLRARNPAATIWIGAKGPRMLAYAAAEADGVRLSGIPLAGISTVIRRIRSEAGRHVATALSPMIASDASEYQRARLRLVHELLSMPAAWRDFIDAPLPATDALRRRFDDEGPRGAATLLSDALVDQFVVTGSDQALLGSLRQMAAEADLDQLILPLGPPEGAAKRLQRLASLRDALGAAE